MYTKPRPVGHAALLWPLIPLLATCPPFRRSRLIHERKHARGDAMPQRRPAVRIAARVSLNAAAPGAAVTEGEQVGGAGVRQGPFRRLVAFAAAYPFVVLAVSEWHKTCFCVLPRGLVDSPVGAAAAPSALLLLLLRRLLLLPCCAVPCCSVLPCPALCCVLLLFCCALRRRRAARHRATQTGPGLHAVAHAQERAVRPRRPGEGPPHRNSTFERTNAALQRN